jgi:hypothetical protein
MNEIETDTESQEMTINELRQVFRLNPIKLKPRKCLRCNREFTSVGPQNRLCDKCREFSGRFSSSTLGQSEADQLGR